MEPSRSTCAEGAGLTVVNPLERSGWDSEIRALPGASFFHESAWPRVLRDSYGHQACYFCVTLEGKLAALLPMMEVRSPVTGRRGVSLPFADFCRPLKQTGGRTRALYQAAVAWGRERRWRFLECRSMDSDWEGASPSVAFVGHVVDFEGGPDQILRRFSNAARRGVEKARASGLEVEFAEDIESMRAFYQLHCRTRRRHGVPPQPWRFFENIARAIMAKHRGVVAIAREGGQSVASAVFFHEPHQVLYKFGASDYRFQHLRPNNLLMCEAMRWHADRRFETMHLGRTSVGNEGLRRFKEGLGARAERIEYCRYDLRTGRFVTAVDRAESWANSVFRLFPVRLLRLAGALLYPHLA